MNDTALQTYNEKGASFPLSIKVTRSLVFRLLKNIHHGQIELREKNEKFIFGNDTSLSAVITILSQDFYKKVLFGGSIGAGEAYINKLWEVDNLTNLVRIMVLNMDKLDAMDRGFSYLLKPLYLLNHIRNMNSKNRAKKNILSHYDLGNDMYRSFLDSTMMYSSAIYPKETSSLEEASNYKLQKICEKLQLNPNDHIIEIGSGWGSFAIFAAQNYGCHVTTTTISNAQYSEAAKRIKKAGLEKKITLLKKDYRDLQGNFDKLVSIEMIEAVGHSYLPQFFKKCGKLLKRNGVMLIQAITIQDQKYDRYVRSVDFIQRHIFPGGCLPSNTRMIDLVTRKTDMVVRYLDDFGTDYARTLRDWRNNFYQSYPFLTKRGFDDRFKRLWEFYLSYCEGGFLEKSISVVHLVATKPENRMSFRDTV